MIQKKPFLLVLRRLDFSLADLPTLTNQTVVVLHKWGLVIYLLKKKEKESFVNALWLLMGKVCFTSLN